MDGLTELARMLDNAKACHRNAKPADRIYWERIIERYERQLEPLRAVPYPASPENARPNP